MTAEDRHAAQVALFRIYLSRLTVRLPERRQAMQAKLADLPRAEVRELLRQARLRERYGG